jgi:hypothetical protein
VGFLWGMGFVFLAIWVWRSIGRAALERQHWKDALEGQHWKGSIRKTALEGRIGRTHWKGSIGRTDRIWRIALEIRFQEREHWDGTINWAVPSALH